LWAVLRQCTGDGRVCFEGNLQRLGILALQGATYDETDLLKRQTTWPRQDFVILPTSAETVSTLKRSLSVPGIFNSHVDLYHVQIEYQGCLVLGAYDNFHRKCVFAREPVTLALLEELVSVGVLRSYEQAPDNT